MLGKSLKDGVKGWVCGKVGGWGAGEGEGGEGVEGGEGGRGGGGGARVVVVVLVLGVGC